MVSLEDSPESRLSFMNSGFPSCQALCLNVCGSLQNFEAAVRLNVLVDGQPWDEAPDLEGTSCRSRRSGSGSSAFNTDVLLR